MEFNATVFETNCPISQVYKDVFYLFVFVIGPISVIGIVFNFISIIVFYRQKNDSNPAFLVKCLAVSDLIFLFFCLCYFPIRHVRSYAIHGDKEVFRRWDPDIGRFMFYGTIPFYFMSQQNRNWLIVIMTVERCVSVFSPLWARGNITKSLLTKIIIANVFMCVSMNLYWFWGFPLLMVEDPCTGEMKLRVMSQAWLTHTDKYLYVLMTVLSPLAILYVANIILIMSLRKAQKRRKDLTGDKDVASQRQATITVISILIVFSICETPACVDRVAAILGFEMPEDSAFTNYSRKIGLLLVVCDSAVNFFAYCASNRQFRRTLVSLF